MTCGQIKNHCSILHCCIPVMDFPYSCFNYFKKAGALGYKYDNMTLKCGIISEKRMKRINYPRKNFEVLKNQHKRRDC